MDLARVALELRGLTRSPGVVVLVFHESKRKPFSLFSATNREVYELLPKTLRALAEGIEHGSPMAEQTQFKF